MNIIGKLGAMQQLIKNGTEKPETTMSDDCITVRKILAEHNPDGKKYDVKRIFHIVEDALRRSTLSSTDSLPPIDHDKDRSHDTGYISMPETLSATINQISSKISYKTLDGVEAHSTTEAVFKMLSIYEWDVKIVLTIASFALTYGDFWLLVHIHNTYQRALSKEIEQKLPPFMENENPQKPRYDALKEIVNITLDLTKCVMDFHDLTTQYIPQDLQDYATDYNYVIVASYWTVRSIVACTAQITILSTLGNENITVDDPWEISTLISKLKSIIHLLREIMNNHRNHIGKKMDDEVHQLLPFIFSNPQTRNEKILLGYTQPLYDAVADKRVSLEPLRWKNVLLLFSGMEISTDELLIVEQIYNETKAHEPTIEGSSIHELVWIPILDPNYKSLQPRQKQFESVRKSMPWYSVYHPSMIVKPVISFIQSEWKYKNKPIVVVLNPQGRVSNPNAIHMMWIWGSAAYPFTRAREEALWKEETWRLELLVNGIDISNLIKDEKHIFLYGGNDLDWVRRFVKEACRVAEATKISLEMVYVGKSSNKMVVQKIIDTIKLERLNTLFLPEQVMIWLFWTRLESMFFSKLQLKQAEDEEDDGDDNDHVMQEIKKLLSYDKQSGWFLLANGSHIVVNGHAKTGLQTLVDYDVWKEQADKDGFDAAFKNHYDKLHSLASICSRFEVSAEIGGIPKRLTCLECHRKMHVFTTVQCCHDGKVDEGLFVTTTNPPPTI